jgi:hypothetical protein
MATIEQKTMGKYCKAYPIARLRAYANWSEKSANARPEDTSQESEGGGAPRQLADDDHLYLQENYVVTDGIFKDEAIIFDDVTPEWIQYCQETLGFEIPQDGPVDVAADRDEATVDGPDAQH